MKRNILCVILAITFIVSVLPIGVAADVIDDVTANNSIAFINLMETLNVIDKTGDLSAKVTRIQYAKMLYNLANINLKSEEKIFADVKSSDSQYASGVHSIGLMQGNGNGSFNPDGMITYNDVMVTLVKLLGFNKNAENLGGYPYGYLSVAIDLNLNKGVKADSLTLGDIIKIFENACKTDMQTIRSISEDITTMQRKKNFTILNQYHDIYYGKGIVSGNHVSSIYGDSYLCKKGELEIDKVVYLYEKELDFKIIGKNMEFYYKETVDSDILEILAIGDLPGKNSELIIESDDFISIIGNTISYEHNESTRKASLSNVYDFILNNRLIIDKTNDDFNLDFGRFRLLDNNGDGIYDLVFATKIETTRLTGISPTDYVLYFESGFSQGGDSLLEIDYKDEHVFFAFYILGKDGVYHVSDIDELQLGSIVNVITSRDKKYTEVYANTDKQNGVLEGMDDETIVLSGVEYKYVPYEGKMPIGLGNTYAFMTDMFGRVVFLDSTVSNEQFSYAMLFNAAQKDGMSGEFQIQVIARGGGDIYNCAEKFYIDGVRVSQGDPDILKSAIFDADGNVIKQLIRIKRDENNLITVIDTANDNNEISINNKLKMDTSSSSLQYNGRMGSFNDLYKINSTTFVVVTKDDLSDSKTLDDFMIGMSWSHESRYNVKVYDVNDAGEIGAIVVHNTSSIGGTEIKDTNSLAVFKSKFKGLNSEGEAVSGINVYINGVLRTLYFHTDYYSAEFEPDLEFGDIIRCSFDNKNNILNYFVEFDIGTKTMRTSNIGRSYMLYGAIYAKGASTLAMIQGRYSKGDQIDLNQRRIVPSSGGNFYMIDIASKSLNRTDFASLPEGLSKNTDGVYYIFTETEYYGNLRNVFLFVE